MVATVKYRIEYLYVASRVNLECSHHKKKIVIIMVTHVNWTIVVIVLQYVQISNHYIEVNVCLLYLNEKRIIFLKEKKTKLSFKCAFEFCTKGMYRYSKNTYTVLFLN